MFWRKYSHWDMRMVFSEAAEAKRDFVAFQTPMPARFLDLIANTTIKTADILVFKKHPL